MSSGVKYFLWKCYCLAKTQKTRSAYQYRMHAAYLTVCCQLLSSNYNSAGKAKLETAKKHKKHSWVLRYTSRKKVACVLEFS